MTAALLLNGSAAWRIHIFRPTRIAAGTVRAKPSDPSLRMPLFFSGARSAVAATCTAVRSRFVHNSRSLSSVALCRKKVN